VSGEPVVRVGSVVQGDDVAMTISSRFGGDDSRVVDYLKVAG
jgi:hypothetical protein